MDKIGSTWDRWGERVGGVMPFSRIGEDLADGATGMVAIECCGGIATQKTGAAPRSYQIIYAICKTSNSRGQMT